jgi:hypothetical protein
MDLAKSPERGPVGRGDFQNRLKTDDSPLQAASASWTEPSRPASIENQFTFQQAPPLSVKSVVALALVFYELRLDAGRRFRSCSRGFL